MTDGNSVMQVGRDLADPFRGDGRRFWGLAASALLLQASFWYWATPGPTVLGLRPRTISYALSDVGMSALFLLLAPLAVARIAGSPKVEERFGLGDVGFGLAVVGAFGALLLPVLYLGTMDGSLQATYPWPADWPGRSWSNLAIWIAAYGVY